MTTYRGFPGRLQHQVPAWAAHGALFHIRIALDRAVKQRLLTDQHWAPLILESAAFYEETHRWHITLFLLMPDHLHALLSFPLDESMSQVVRNWKRFHKRTQKIIWEENYFDHRLRDDERGEQLTAKINYIRNNPVAAGLCENADDWPWKIDPLNDNSTRE